MNLFTRLAQWLDAKATERIEAEVRRQELARMEHALNYAYKASRPNPNGA